MDAIDAAKHDLLFGLLALQNGLIDQVQLVAAFQAWTHDKTRSLAEHFEARRDLDPGDRLLVEALVSRHLKKHGGDAEMSLAALAVAPSTRKSLVQLDDPVIEASLAQVPAGSIDDPDRTVMYSVGTATSDGQRFRVLRPHAKGGLGAVFVALDDELHREVALKQILDAHADDPVTRQRFLLEAEITGGLEHPGIVPVYGLGTYGDGRPYYAMRFIRGDSLKEAIVSFHTDKSLKRDTGQRSLELRKLLRRFTDVCNAIDYAHGRGVLHRDIKPGNIIVGKHGETLVVDWGLAKATGKADHVAGERTLTLSSASGSGQTLPGSTLGTPAYMSPEQAAGDLECLGPPSDVYSLGATFYCLLTGKPPFEGNDVGEILRNVQKGTFPRPRSLDPTIDRALEAVCLKAMALRPQDRYASCKTVASEVDNWMADEPVTAWREPFSRRARRWGRRHRTLVTGFAAALVVAVLGMSALILVQARANEAERRSKALVAAEFDLALNAVKAYYQGVTADVLLAEPAMASLKQTLLQSPRKFFQDLATTLEESGQKDPQTRKKLANACTDLGRISEKIGKPEDAIEAYRQAINIRETLARELPSDAFDRIDLAENYDRKGNAESFRGRTDLAESDYQTALSMLAQVVKDRPDDVRALFQLTNTQNSIAVLDQSLGHYKSAETNFLDALTTRRRLEKLDPNNREYRDGLAWTLNSLGLLYRAIGKPGQAAEQYRAAMQIQEELIRQHPEIVKYRLSLSHHYNNLAIVHNDLGEFDAATRDYREAIRISLDLFHEQPAVAKYRDDLGVAYANLGGHLNDLRRFDEAEKELHSALEILEPLSREYPGIGEYQNDLASVHNNLGLLFERTNRLDSAKTAQAAAVKIRKELSERFPDVPEYRIRFAGSMMNLADLARTPDEFARALETCTHMIGILNEVLRVEPKDVTAREYLGNAYWSQAETLGRLDRHADALAAWERALELAANDRVRASMIARRALTKIRLGQIEQAIAEAEALIRPDESTDGDALYNVACVYSQAAEAISTAVQGDAIERARRADLLVDRAMSLFKQLAVKDFFQVPANLSNLQTDPDLAWLMTRADFQGLIRELETKK